MKIKADRATVVRTVVLAIALVNQVLLLLGWNPLPFDGEEIYAGVSAAATVAASLWSWWKNNSFTAEARQADAYLAELKRR